MSVFNRKSKNNITGIWFPKLSLQSDVGPQVSSQLFITPSLHVQILQDLVLFVHSQAAMLKEKSTTIEKQSETIDILSTRVQRLEDDNLVRFQLYLLLARLESAYLWIRGAHQI